MKAEPIFSSYLFVREVQYAWLLNFWELQSFFFADTPEILYSKGIFDKGKGWLERLLKPFKGKKPKQPEIDFENFDINNIDFSQYDEDVFHFISNNWNEVYESEKPRATVLGTIAEFMIGKGEKPNELKEMSLNQLNGLLTDKYELPGLEDPEKLMEETGLSGTQFYSYLYAKDKGAEWLAIYDDQGNRSGRSYEVVTKMYRAILAEAIKQGKTPDQIRTEFIFPGIDKMRQDFFEGEWTPEKETEFQDLIDKHLNRDMERFAVTDVSIAVNNGRLLQGLVEGRRYVRFSR